MRKYLLAISAACVGFTAVGFGAKPAKPLFTVSKETTVVTEPLTADGRPDYVAYINEKYGKGVTPEKNGFALLVQIVGPDEALSPVVKEQVMAMLKAPAGTGERLKIFSKYLEDQHVDGGRRDKLVDQFDTLSEGLWKREDFPEAAGYLEKYGEQLTQVGEAAARTEWYSPYVGKSCIAMLLPSMGVSRVSAMSLCARAMLCEEEGDFAGFLRDITAARRLARHISAGPTLIEVLVGAAIERRACAAEGMVAATGKFTSAEIRELEKADGRLWPMPAMWPVADGCERWSILEWAMMLSLGQTNDLKDWGNVALFGAVKPEDVDWNMVLKLLNEVMDEEVEGMKYQNLGLANAAMGRFDMAIERFKLETQRGLVKERGESREDYSARVAGAICATFCAALGRANMLEGRCTLDREMLKVMLGAGRYKAEKGAWPGKLDELVPEYVESLPSDLFGRESEHVPLHMQVSHGELRIYSVGENGKDDGCDRRLDEVMGGSSGHP